MHPVIDLLHLNDRDLLIPRRNKFFTDVSQNAIGAIKEKEFFFFRVCGVLWLVELEAWITIVVDLYGVLEDD